MDIASEAGAAAPRARACANICYEHGVLVRPLGDTLILSPPLIIETEHVEKIVGTIARGLKATE